uniref:Uncharacterized protein n=1 Tax=Onchocerca volvulus TaxID=6282 RepID=A0A8R1XYS2_ONCVO
MLWFITFSCFMYFFTSITAETNEKGCNDNLSNSWNCQALGEACVQAGGRACCDTCAEDLCNNAIVFVSPILFAILSVLFTLSITVYI